jgi:bifunctional non-homologous end joining protein LigD
VRRLWGRKTSDRQLRASQYAADQMWSDHSGPDHDTPDHTVAAQPPLAPASGAHRPKVVVMLQSVTHRAGGVTTSGRRVIRSAPNLDLTFGVADLRPWGSMVGDQPTSEEPVEFMLAERGTEADLERLQQAGYVFDLKVDGIRALVTVSGADPGVAMTTRLGHDLTRRFPELAQALLAVGRANPGTVLDAEVAVPDAQGLPSWPLTQQRTAQHSGGARWAARLPARLYVFDVLRLEGEPTRPWPYHRRRDALEELAADWEAPLGLTLASAEPWPLWDVVTRHRLEGVIAKRRTSRYRAGRSPDWVKVKAVRTVSCLVGGVDRGPEDGLAAGRRGQPRALELYLVGADGELVPIGRVGAAASGRLRRELEAGLAAPPLIVEVEYSDLTTAGRLRQPVLRRVRTDLDVLACGIDQLTMPGATGPGGRR